MYIAAGKSFWFQTVFTLSADTTKEALTVKRLKTTTQEAARSQETVAKIKNEIVFISNEPTLSSLGRVENVETPQSRAISDSIKSDFDDYDFTNAHLKYHNNYLYVALPAESKVLVYNIKEGFWEAPQILPVRRLAIVGGDLYGHSSAVPESYKLFDGTNDNTNPIEARAAFSYMKFGKWAQQKSLDEWYTEGYISSNTDLTLGLKYDFGGFTSIQEFTIRGDNDAILFQTIADGSLGKNPIGSQPIGSVTDSLDDLAKFRVINETVRQDFFELQPIYESNDIDFQWKLLAFGPSAQMSKAEPVSIKQ